jgi:hypothetical protein
MWGNFLKEVPPELCSTPFKNLKKETRLQLYGRKRILSYMTKIGFSNGNTVIFLKVLERGMGKTSFKKFSP